MTPGVGRPAREGAAGPEGEEIKEAAMPWQGWGPAGNQMTSKCGDSRGHPRMSLGQHRLLEAIDATRSWTWKILAEK